MATRLENNHTKQLLWIKGKMMLKRDYSDAIFSLVLSVFWVQSNTTSVILISELITVARQTNEVAKRVAKSTLYEYRLLICRTNKPK